MYDILITYSMLITHGIIYLVSFIFSYYFANNDIYKFINLVILGWSLFGLTSIGHELYHLKIDKKNRITNFFVDLVGFCCLDLWGVSKENWIDRHNKWHHY